ncbi:MAG TPA: CPBP family intramembrane glutamic endopeptidase [Candidatus Acidoferrales bacterium]
MDTPPQPVPLRGGWVLGPDHLIRPFLRALLFAVFAVISALLVAGAVTTLTRGAGGATRLIVYYAVLVSVHLLLTWWMLTLVDRASFRTLGLWFYPGWARELGIGAVLGLGVQTVTVAILVAGGWVEYTGVAPDTSRVLPSVAGAAVLLLLAGSWEEIVFRGYPFQRLVDSVGALGAVAVFSILFGAVHTANPSANALSTANTVLAGALLAAAYLKTRALWLPIGLHVMWNFSMGMLYSLPISGIRFGTPPLVAEPHGPEWLSGGAYGPEGSVVLTVAAAALLVWMVRTPLLATSAAMNDILRKREGP